MVMFLLENAFAKEKSLEERKTDATLLDLQNATKCIVSVVIDSVGFFLLQACHF